MVRKGALAVPALLSLPFVATENVAARAGRGERIRLRNTQSSRTSRGDIVSFRGASARAAGVGTQGPSPDAEGGQWLVRRRGVLPRGPRRKRRLGRRESTQRRTVRSRGRCRRPRRDGRHRAQLRQGQPQAVEHDLAGFLAILITVAPERS